MQLVQHSLKDVGIKVEMKVQEYGAYMATTFLGKYEGMAMGPLSITWEPDSVLYGMYAPDRRATALMSTTPRSRPCSRNNGARLRRTLEARKQLIFDIQRYVAAQQYWCSPTLICSRAPGSHT